LFHPHIVGVYDRGEFDGRLWISMDYVEGTDVAQLMRGWYPDGMPTDEALTIVTAVAGAANANANASGGDKPARDGRCSRRP
jgi:serine/threonine-protein kinase